MYPLTTTGWFRCLPFSRLGEMVPSFHLSLGKPTIEAGWGLLAIFPTGEPNPTTGGAPAAPPIELPPELAPLVEPATLPVPPLALVPPAFAAPAAAEPPMFAPVPAVALPLPPVAAPAL